MPQRANGAQALIACIRLAFALPGSTPGNTIGSVTPAEP